MGMRISLAAAVAALSLVACSPTEQEEAKGSLPPNAIVLEASPATRRDLGVERWALENDGAGDLKGYDADLQVRVVFEHHEQARDGGTLQAYVLGEGEDSARIVLMRDANRALTILETTIDGRFEHVAELMIEDLRAMRTSGAALATTSLALRTGSTLSPKDDLADANVELVCADCRLALAKLQVANLEVVQACKSAEQIKTDCQNRKYAAGQRQATLEECTKDDVDACNAAGAKVAPAVTAAKCVDSAQYKQWCSPMKGIGSMISGEK